jgi:hypothetical protein
MNSKKQKEPDLSAKNAKTIAKRPYVKPEVRHEKVFETMALSCGKQGSEGACQFNRRTS